MKRLFAALAFLVSLALPAAAATPKGLVVTVPPHNGGLNLTLRWAPAPGDKPQGFAVLRATTPDGPWETAVDFLSPETLEYTDTVTTNAWEKPPEDLYYYRVVTLGPATPAPPDIPEDASPEAREQARAAFAVALLASGEACAAVEGRPAAHWFNASAGHITLLSLITLIGALILFYTRSAQRGASFYIRRIPGIDAIEEGIGRATEMGKPVLYVPGIDELQDIQTIASMLILGQVAKKIAEYQADLIVSCCIPIVREVADEVVRAGFYQAGYPDAYNPANTRFISSEQFAFTAGTNGIILREKPATNLYLGRFFAESLILAETGYVNRSIQIGGTAEVIQLPFFVAACDYTLIGEELFAVSAYLSKDPRLVSSLRASDVVKGLCLLVLVIGTLAACFGNMTIIEIFTIAE